MPTSVSLQGGVVYYAREKYYHHIMTEILELQKKYGLEPILVYWKAFSLVMTGLFEVAVTIFNFISYNWIL